MEDKVEDNLSGSEVMKQDQVKRPMNAFMLWSKEKRRKISSVDPSLHNSHISKILGEEWKKLPMKEKDPYIKQSKSLMDKHKKEHPDYHYKPRQNKLTKALKELSSLHSNLSTPPSFASKVRSLSNMSAFVNVSRTSHCSPYPAYLRSKSYQRCEREPRYYYDVPEYYSRPALCSGCTCSMDCKDMSVMARQHYLAHQRYLASYESYRSSHAIYMDNFSHNHKTWKCFSAPSRHGWSVPTLVEDMADRCEDRSEGMQENSFGESTNERSETSVSDGCSKDDSILEESS